MFESELHEHGPSLRLPVKLQTTKTDYDSSGEPEFFQNPMNVAAAVKKVGPAVVRIDNTDSQGSGVIFSRDGKILTNAHVVKDCTTTIQVTLRDGQTFPAKVRGVDVVNDLAVLQLDTKATTKELPVAQLGNSDKLDVGDFVVAIGTPAGLGNTATMGIVSNLSRSSRELGYSAGQKGGDKTFNYIQTDAAINFGNSGGPLVNTRGEVVGINTSKFSRSEGIAFSIPTNAIKEILDDLCQGIVMKRPYLGVVMKPMTPKLAAAHNLDPNASMMCPEVNGAYVEHVTVDSPAAKGGVRRGDVIVEVGGVKCEDADEVLRAVGGAIPNEELTVKVVRWGGSSKGKVHIFVLRPTDMNSKMENE